MRRTLRTGRVVTAALLVGLVTTRRLHAEPAHPSSSTVPRANGAETSGPTRMSNEGRADQLFHAGEKKFDGGDYAGACADFSASLKLGPKLGTLLNLALCHERIGKPVTAWSEFTHAAAWAAQNNQKDRLEFASAHVRGLEPKLPRVVLELPHPEIQSLDLDGEPLPEQRWYLPLYLDPGEHHVAVAAPGKKRTSVSFRVSESGQEQIVMIPALHDDEAALFPDRPADPSRRTLGIAALGVGAAGVVVGTIFGVLAIVADSESATKTDATIATFAFVGGAAFAATGAWLSWTSSRRSGPSVAPRVGARAVGIAAAF